MTRVLALTPDLFFSTRIQSTLERAGHAVRVVDTDDAEAIHEALFALSPALAILDIGTIMPWEWQQVIQTLREADSDLPILAFGSHTQVEATRAALALGVTRVVAKSEFTSNMLNLVERYAISE